MKTRRLPGSARQSAILVVMPTNWYLISRTPQDRVIQVVVLLVLAAVFLMALLLSSGSDPKMFFALVLLACGGRAAWLILIRGVRLRDWRS